MVLQTLEKVSRRSEEMRSGRVSFTNENAKWLGGKSPLLCPAFLKFLGLLSLFQLLG